MNTEVKTRLYRTPFYNPFFCNGYEVSNLVFYKDGEVILSTPWFGSNNDYKSIEFNFEVKRSTKLNLNRKDAFLILDKECTYKKGYNLYIPADFVNLESLGKTRCANGWYSITDYENFQVTITGERWVYEKVEGQEKLERVLKYGTYTEKVQTIIKSENTEEYEKCEKLAGELSKLIYTNLSAIEVHNLLHHYDIIKKN